MKKLIYEQKEAIEKHQSYANQLVTSLNMVLIRFKEGHNHFGQPIDESFAFELVTNPVGTFDNLLRANSPIKPIGGKSLDIEKLAELTGIDRPAFIQDFTIVLPGSIDQYNKHGRTALFQLNQVSRELVSWKDNEFALNPDMLSKQCEIWRVYAETDGQLKEVEYWQNLCTVMNEHAARVKLDAIDSNQLARMFKINYQNAKFLPDYKVLSGQIKSMVAVN